MLIDRCYSQEAVELLARNLDLVPRLRVLAVNHASCYGGKILDRLMGQLEAPVCGDQCSQREALRAVILCDNMWCRKDANGKWEVTESTPVEDFLWYDNREQGDWVAPWDMY